VPGSIEAFQKSNAVHAKLSPLAKMREGCCNIIYIADTILRAQRDPQEITRICKELQS